MKEGCKVNLERVKEYKHPSAGEQEKITMLASTQLPIKRLRQLAAQLLMRTEKAFDMLHFELRVAIKEVAEGRECPLPCGMYPWCYRNTYLFQAYEAAMAAAFRTRRPSVMSGIVLSLRHFVPIKELFAWLEAHDDLMDDVAKQALAPKRRKK